MIYFKAFDLILRFVAPLVEETVLNSHTPDIQKVKTGLSLLFFLITIPVIVVILFIIRFVYKNIIAEKRRTTLIEDYKKEAVGYEKAGRFVSAANIYENKLRDTKKAATLYEKGKDYKKAAELYEFLGMTDRAKEIYEKDGNVLAAAEVSISEGEYVEAAKFYERAGDKLKVARALEEAGRKLAAVRAYREAGEFRRASILLEEEGLLSESAEMFGLSLKEKEIKSNIGDFYTYACKLERAGNAQKALDVLKEIERVDAQFKDVRDRLKKLTPPYEEDLDGRVTLRSIVKNGKIEPKHSLKLWIQIFKNLQESYNKGRDYGILSPENIALDSHNNISFLNGLPSSEYISPERIKGFTLDVRADIYSMGAILYEMLTGKLDGLGSARVIDIAEDVPDWLDEIVIKCIKKVREDRYQSIEDIFADLKALSKGTRDSNETS